MSRLATLAVIAILLAATAGKSIAQVVAGRPSGALTVTAKEKTGETASIELYRESHALLIGMSDYQKDGWEDLPEVPAELKSVRAALERHGFQLFDNKTHIDLSGDAVRQLFDRFVKGPGQKRGARLVVYLSGHGQTIEEFGKPVGYFVPVDGPHPNFGRREFRLNAIHESDFRNWAAKLGVRHSLFLFDCCFSGSFLSPTKSGDLLIPPVLRRQVENPYCGAMSAGGNQELVPTPSVFSRAFVQALTSRDANGSDAYLTAGELYQFLKTRVTKVTEGKNRAGEGSLRSFPDGDGEMVFEVGGRAATPELVPVPGAPRIEVMNGVLWVSTEEAAWVSVGGSEEYELSPGRWAKYEGEFAIPVGEQEVTARAVKDGVRFEQRVVVGATARAEVVIRFARGVRLPEDLEVVEGAEYASLTGLAAGSREAQKRQRAEAKRLGLPLEVKNKRTGMVFRFVPAGEYTMGSPAGEADRISKNETQRRVKIPRGLYVGKYEVTQEEWEGLMGANPSEFKGVGRRGPVEQLFAKECDEYVGRLGKEYRLLTHEEWEYACRGGTATAFCFGESLMSHQANIDGKKTTPVGSFEPNSWGLYDMHGNAFEWTSSHFEGGPDRMIRGGCWNHDAKYCRSAYQRRGYPDHYRYGDLGFRVARVLQEVNPSVSTPAAPTSSGQVFLGIEPDFAFAGPGVKVAGITHGSPAVVAGIRIGDVLLSIGGKELADLRAYSKRLREYQPGDKVTLQYQRGEVLIEAKVRLKAR